MAKLPKEIHEFRAVSIKIPMAFHRNRKVSLLQFIRKYKRPQIAKTILRKRTMLEVSQYQTSNYTTESQQQKHGF
jgi:hypothetical protein